jgi:uncharacterized protein involved in outer membrane biogenesis
VQTTGTEPLVTAPEVRARYHLWDIIGGNINVDEVVLTSPKVNIVHQADGTSNLDPLTKGQPTSPEETKRPSESDSKPPQIQIGKFALIDATVRLIQRVLGNADSTVEESFAAGLLEFPQYTRPTDWEGLRIPEVLLSGHHGRIAAWRHSQAERLTKERRPDLWRAYLAAAGKANPDGEAELSDAHTTAATGGQEKDDAT